MKYGNLGETVLYERLHKGFRDSEDSEIAEQLCADLTRICAEASERMKRMHALHEQYTLHDEVHLRRVTALMSLVMPQEVIEELNPVELALLILSAYLHDQGMVPEKERLENIRMGEDSELREFERHWSIDNPKLRQVRETLADETLNEESKERYRIVEQQLRDTMITDFVRQGHGRRSAECVRERYGGSDLLNVHTVDLTPLLAKLCESHERSIEWFSKANGFGVDERVGGYDVNMHYLAFVLRLADILDFDRDRVPEPVYKNITFTSDVSLKEWEKHRSIRGWKIEPELIQFTAECEHPVYEKALDEFMAWIDRELEGARSSVSDYSPGIREKYHFNNLPHSVDRTRIRPKEGAYIYRNVEFSLSRDDVVRLLMTDKLYRSTSLCVRELLQNSLDALRHRVALYRRDDANLQPNGVYLRHELDENGQELLVCRDDGVGMDVGIVETFLTKVGRSYYRSPQFEREREKLKAKNEDFDPCARFGIGFMSCFMLGDRIRIRTRRDNGPSEGRGEPLEVEIDGLDSMIVIRKGPADMQPGTEVEVTVREKPLVYDKNTDQVKLTEVVYGYAVACEFPIEAHCTIPGIVSDAHPPVGVYEKLTEMERVRLGEIETLTQDFSEIDDRLQGKVRASFLKDKDGNLAIENDEAYWTRDDEQGYDTVLMLLKREEGWKEESWNQNRLRGMDKSYTAGHICMDGIVVSGALRTATGWGKIPPGGDIGPHLGRAYFTLDVRGNIKPPLTPARTPDRGDTGEPPVFGRALGDHPDWLRVRKLANLAGGRLWEQVAERCAGKPDLFWQLAAIYQVIHTSGSSLLWMRAEHIWSILRYPILASHGNIEWFRPSDIGSLFPHFPVEEEYIDLDERPWLDTRDGRPIKAPASVERWLKHEYTLFDGENVEHRSDPGWDEYTFLEPLLALSTLTLEKGWPVVELREPTDPNLIPGEHLLLTLLDDENTGSVPLIMSYSGDLRDFLAVEFVRQSINRDHPIVQLAIAAQYKERLTEIERFAESLVRHATDMSNFYDAVARAYPTAQDSLRYLGAMFRAVDWGNVAEEYHAPYQLWSREQGFDSLTKERFIEWSNFQPRNI